MVDNLTRRERECLALVASGLTNEGIAGRLELAIETVRTHLNHCYQRLDVQDAGNPRVVAAVMWAKEAGKEE
jgi:ATP/maltotriose-dependent transcriptional regulator MalT